MKDQALGGQQERKEMSNNGRWVSREAGAVAIIGLGGVFPGAGSVPAFWQNIQNGHVAIREVPKNRWNAALYFSEDRSIPEKTYSCIGGFLDAVAFDPKRFRIPPRAAPSIDDLQKLVLNGVAEALQDAKLEVFSGSGDGRPFNRDRTAVILGNTMGGEAEDLTSLRVWFAEALQVITESDAVKAMMPVDRERLLRDIEQRYKGKLPPVTEDSMPGELSNCITGRVANAFDLRGPNFTTDAACAASMAAIKTASGGLVAGEYDLAIAGGADRSMDPPTYVKFAKIGALSGRISAPFDARADGFVMGEGVGVLVLKRLADAVADGDRIYAVIRGMGAASDGKGKGMTAPNSRGQRLAVERAYAAAGVSVASVDLFEAHGTSTTVGDSTELRVLTDLLNAADIPRDKPAAIGSVKSMIGHLKSAAGAASMIKAALALYHRVLPPSANFVSPPVDSPLAEGRLVVQAKAAAWESTGPRRVGVSAFGFGGTNFHAVLEEFRVEESGENPAVFVFGAESREAVIDKARGLVGDAPENGARLPAACLAERESAAAQPVRLAFVAKDIPSARQKIADAARRRPKLLSAQGIFLHEPTEDVPEGKLAFVFPGQGSQYLGMFRDLAARYPQVAHSFAEADETLEPLLGVKLTDIIWASCESDAARDVAELQLRQTQNCQPAMLAADVAMLRLLHAHGIEPDMVAGHSLGEYAACVASGVLSFRDALYAVSARGREMAGIKVEDHGKMATVAADVGKVEALLAQIDGYVIAANKNCHGQTVIAGASDAVMDAIARFAQMGVEAKTIPVSHAFHSSIVALATKPLARVLSGLDVRPPVMPILSNVNAGYYPNDKQGIVYLLALQLASPVEFIGQIERMYDDGARVFVEVGPRRAITGFVRNILGTRPHQALATNHHKKSGCACFAEVLAALASMGRPVRFAPSGRSELPRAAKVAVAAPKAAPAAVVSGVGVALPCAQPFKPLDVDVFADLLDGRNFIEPLDAPSKHAILHKNVARLDKQAGHFERLHDLSDVLQLAARFGEMDIAKTHGLDPNFVDALDQTGRLAVAVGIDALRDAGLPLVRRYRTTSTGKQLADRWALPPALARSTGVILASAFPGVDRLVDEVSRNVAARAKAESADVVGIFIAGMAASLRDPAEAERLRQGYAAVASSLREEADHYAFNRKFLFRVLALGHAQLAQTILAQGPNTQINAACASGTQAVGLATDWLHLGRCERVLVVSADDVTNTAMLPWIAAGFLAVGAATTESDLTQAAVPFGAQRNGMLLGAGAAAFVIERDDCLAQRGMEPVAEVVATKFVNSAFHGTRLDGTFIKEALAEVVDDAMTVLGCTREALAQRAFFMSHETYTPARGGSSLAEVDAIRHVFGDEASALLIANTKGYTGHPMGTTFEDVVAMKALQRGRLPGIANLNDVDPAFGDLRFARGGAMSCDVALRFAAGFGSQVALAIYRQRARNEARLVSPQRYEAWLTEHVGHADVGLELVSRTLRVAEEGGKKAWELGVPSLALQRDLPVEASPTASSSPVAAVEVDGVGERPDRAAVVADLIALFAEQTGYGVADLDPDYALEADLGIDTVKQAEIFALIRQRYGLGMDDDFKLADVQTLAAIADYVVASRPGNMPAADVEPPSEVPVRAEPATSLSDRATLIAELVDLFAEQTGYSPADLDPSYALEADLGIDTVKQAEIFGLIRTRFGLPQDDAFKLVDAASLEAIADYVLAQQASARGSVARGSVARGSVARGSVARGSARAVGESATSATVGTAEAPQEATPKGAVQTNRDVLVDQLVALFVEQTGYDASDLDPSYALEADLGIDTVKQAEIFSLLRQRYGLPQDDAFRLSDVQTIHAIADYVQANAPVAAAVGDVEAPRAVAGDRDALVAELVTLFAQQTGYERADLDPSYGLEADLGIDTVKQAEIFSSIRERFALPQDDGFRLSEVQTIHAIADYVRGQLGGRAQPPVAPSLAAADVASERALPSALELGASAGFTARGTSLAAIPRLRGKARSMRGRRVVLCGGVACSALRDAMQRQLQDAGAEVYLASDVAELLPRLANLGGDAVDDLVFFAAPVASGAAVETLADRLFTLCRAFARGRRSLDDAGVLVVDSRGGAFGFHGDDLTGASAASLAGLCKALGKEWPKARALAVHLDAPVDVDAAANAVLQAFLHPGPAELVWHRGEMQTIRRDQQPIRCTARPLRDGAVVVATGGARGITYGLVRKICAGVRVRLVLLGRTPGLAPHESPLHGRSPAEQKALARAALEKAGVRGTPLEVMRWIEMQERRQEVWRHCEALREDGALVTFLSCDVADASALDVAMAGILRDFGAVDLVLHGAGVEESKFLVDKDAGAFVRTFRPKAGAALALWQGLRPRRMVTMGSVAGRFGNAGQADYAAANEAMSGLARHHGINRISAEDRSILNIAWTAWADLGMAVRGSVGRVLQDAGVALMPSEIGIALGAKLILSDVCGEVVVAGKLGALDAGESEVLGAADRDDDDAPLPPLFQRLERDGDLLVLVRRLDPAVDRGLEDHRIDGVAVLAGVLGVEMMQQAAAYALGAPVALLRDVRFAVPLKLFRDEALDVRVEVRAQDEQAQVVLTSLFQSPGGKVVRREHFFATACREGADMVLPAPGALEMARDPEITREAIYKRYFHGLSFQVLQGVEALGDNGIRACPRQDRPTWLAGTTYANFATLPALREAGFQAAGLFEMAEFGRMALPAAIDVLYLAAPPPLDARLTVEVRRHASPGGSGEAFDVWVCDTDGVVYDYMSGYRTVVLRDLAPLERFEPSRADGQLPVSLSVEVAEIQARFRADPESTLDHYLSPGEKVRFGTLKVEKRQVEWLAVRIAAKRLIRETFFHSEGAIVPYTAITLHRDPLGAPYVEVVGEQGAPPQVSLSHSGGVATAFLSHDPCLRPGVDVEIIERRDEGFGALYFTEAERTQVRRADDGDRVMTEIWAVKESVLKALGVGARVSFKDVEALAVDGRWQVSFRGEALQRAQILRAGKPKIRVERQGRCVFAQVLLPVAGALDVHGTQAASQAAISEVVNA